MIGYIMVGTNDLDRSIKFYDELFKILDLERIETDNVCACLLYTSPSPRDATLSRMPSSA